MGILCKLFGHRPEEGYYGDDADGNGYGYFKLSPAGKDGLGRHHAFVNADCRRCGKTFSVGKIHLPEADNGK